VVTESGDRFMLILKYLSNYFYLSPLSPPKNTPYRAEKNAGSVGHQEVPRVFSFLHRGVFLVVTVVTEAKMRLTHLLSRKICHQFCHQAVTRGGDKRAESGLCPPKRNRPGRLRGGRDTDHQTGPPSPPTSPPTPGTASGAWASRPATDADRDGEPMPKDCLRTKHARLTCDRCGGPADHMPLKLAGWFCAACCPACARCTPAPSQRHTGRPQAGQGASEGTR
jgi:hypothetical protein